MRHVRGIGAILILGDSAPNLTRLVATKNRLVCGKLMARQVLTRFDVTRRNPQEKNNGFVKSWGRDVCFYPPGVRAGIFFSRFSIASRTTDQAKEGLLIVYFGQKKVMLASNKV